MNQVRLGKRGERIAQGVVGGRRTRQQSPFDVIDRPNQFAYEVKCQHAHKHVRVHIEQEAYDRKIAYALKNRLMPMLVLVLIVAPGEIELYTCPLRRHARPSNMRRVQ